MMWAARPRSDSNDRCLLIMDAIKAANLAVAKTAIVSLQQASDPGGFRLALRSATNFDCADPELEHDSIFAEAGRRGLARDLAVGLVEYACRDAHVVPQGKRPIYFVHVPIAIVADPRFQADLERTVEAMGLDRARLCLEIQENRFSEGFSVSGLHQLVHRGFLLSLAGFGTGMACFAALKCFPLSYVQVAPSFVSEFLTDPISRELVRASIEIAHLTGRRSIASGVDSHECISTLLSLGADYVEGPGVQTAPRH